MTVSEPVVPITGTARCERRITELPLTQPVVSILGAGPAGMSCANACLSFGLTPVVIERDDHAGGIQRTNFHHNLWMLGSPGETGEAMCRRMADHFATLAVPTYFRCEVTEVGMEGDRFHLKLSNGPDGAPASLRADAIVLAMGTRPKASAELETLARSCERVIIGPLSHIIRDGICGCEVLIMGGGDNALDHALFLCERGNRVTVCTRAAFSARAAFLAACQDRIDITLRTQCRPLAILPQDDGLRVRWSNEEQDFDWLLVMYGYRPNTDVLECFQSPLRPALTTGGHVCVDAWQRTSVPNLYAAGDITESAQPSVPTAIAQGLAAARAIERDWSPGHGTNPSAHLFIQSPENQPAGG